MFLGVPIQQIEKLRDWRSSLWSQFIPHENLVKLLEIYFLVTDLVQPSIDPVPGVCVAFPAPAPGNYELQSLCQESEDKNIKRW